MRVVKSILLAMVLILPFTLQAEEANKTTTKEAVKQEKKQTESKDALQAAKELFDVMKLKEIYAKIVDDATQSLVKRAPKLKSVQSKIHAFYNKYIGWDALKDDMAKIYAKYYSAKELEELTNFYKTELGKKTLKMLPKISMESRRLGMKNVMDHQKELQDIVQKALQPKEEKKESKKETNK